MSTHVHEDDEWVVVPSTTELVARITVRTKRIAKSAFDDMCVRVTRLARDPKKLVRHLLVLLVVSCVARLRRELRRRPAARVSRAR